MMDSPLFDSRASTFRVQYMIPKLYTFPAAWRRMFPSQILTFPLRNPYVMPEPGQRPRSSDNKPSFFTALGLAAAAVVVVVGSIICIGSASSTSSTLSDELASVEDAKKLREEARRHGLEMSDAYSRAKTAQQRRQRGAAKEHRERGGAHKSSMEGLDERAANIFFRENNKNRQRGEIDLHGLLVAEAVKFTKEELQSAVTRGDRVLRFIVGKGMHSQGEAKLRPALEELFTGLGLSHFPDVNNSGVFITFMVQLF